MDTFLLEKAIYELNFDLRTRPDWALVPMLGILSILNRLKRQ
jgi:maltose alpha-D-glucosyltransferase/alpha-amylase